MPDLPPLVTGVDFVSLPTQDLEAAILFYGETLGLERSQLWGRSLEDAKGVEFETGTVTIALLAVERLGITFASSTVPVALRVDDVEAARSALEARGVTFFADTMDSGVCHMAHFADPDGNVLMLHRRYAPKA